MTNPIAPFPRGRLRRTRMTAWSRRLTAETRLSVDDLVWSVIVREGEGLEEPVPSMPGVARLSVDRLVAAAAQAKALGVPALAIFPHTDAARRSPEGDEGLNPDNLMCRALRTVKDAVPDIGLICDVALDPYTSHGHDGVLRDGDIANDETVEKLVVQAVNQAAAGADVIAPSDMMDGRIGAIRDALETEGFRDVQILSYAAKYASAFYGPYRDAIGSKGVLQGDKRTYQMDLANSDEALRETALDLSEGADAIMVKPGLAYLDIVRRLKDAFAAPTFVFQVSGEYAAIMAAGQNGWLDGEAAMMESLAAFKRAGADAILTYYALQAAQHLRP